MGGFFYVENNKELRICEAGQKKIEIIIFLRLVFSALLHIKASNCKDEKTSVPLVRQAQQKKQHRSFPEEAK